MEKFMLSMSIERKIGLIIMVIAIIMGIYLSFNGYDRAITSLDNRGIQIQWMFTGACIVWFITLLMTFLLGFTLFNYKKF